MNQSTITNNNSISIDIETLDIKKTSIIVSVGCVVFNKDTPINEFCIEKDFILNLKEQSRLGRTVGIDTILWWLEHNSNNLAIFNTNPNSCFQLQDFIDNFYNLIKTNDVNESWAKSPNFDLEILNNLYNQLHYEFPLDFRGWMDVRTILNVRKYLNLEDIPFKYNKHSSLGDAKHQAEIIIDTYQYLKTKNSL